MERNEDVVVAGHLCLDVIPDLAESEHDWIKEGFLPGRMVQVGAATISTGGAVSNTGLALHRLGARVCLVGKIGDDVFGRAVRRIVASFDPDLPHDLVVEETAHTSYTVILNPPGVDRMFLHCPGANDTFGAGDVPYDRVSRARLFHFGYPPTLKPMFEDGGVQLAQMFRRVKALDRTAPVTTSLDMTFPDPASPAGLADWRSILRRTLPYVDLILPSLEEILFMLHRERYERLCREAGGTAIGPLITPQLLSEVGQDLLDLGARVVVLKLGERGLYVRTADRAAMEQMGRAGPVDPDAWVGKEVWAPCFRVQVAGTTGAGDATVAGFLAALLRGMSLQETVTAALAVGACNVEAVDALGGLRSWEETQQRVVGSWERHPLHVDAPGWQFDSDHHLWWRECR